MNRELIAAYLNGEVKTLTNSEQKELARIALASLTAEPAKCGLRRRQSRMPVLWKGVGGLNNAFTKEQLIAKLQHRLTVAAKYPDVEEAELDAAIFKIALASLEAGSDNHPAHGPLSNYRLHRIREILSKAATQSDGGNIGYAMSDAVKAIDELLAGRKSEPDYIRYDCGCCGWETIEDWRDNDVCPKCNHKPMGKTELFIAPPAPVVPATLPCAVELKPGLIIGKGCKTETLLTALQRRADYYAEIDAMTPEERAEHDANIEAFKAMLNGGKS